MLAGLSELGQAYLSILNVYSLSYGLAGALLGIIVGCLPGLSATLCIALLTTLTIKLAPNDAILILICSYVGTLYGGSRTAILLNIPGTAANAASCADGHALALRGEAGRAIAVWRAVSRRVHATARRGLALVRGVRVLLARSARRGDVRQHRRQ
jgi:putative tricarboxylic transport membrane protein